MKQLAEMQRQLAEAARQATGGRAVKKVVAAMRFAQIGDEGRCARCGYKVEFREVGDGAMWVAVRRTSRAPRSTECPARTSPGPHRTETHGATGTPL